MRLLRGKTVDLSGQYLTCVRLLASVRCAWGRNGTRILRHCLLSEACAEQFALTCTGRSRSGLETLLTSSSLVTPFESDNKSEDADLGVAAQCPWTAREREEKERVESTWTPGEKNKIIPCI